MTDADLRSERLSLLARWRVRLGRCPDCGERLEDKILPELVEAWNYTMPKYIARTRRDRPAPQTHVTELPAVSYCERCQRWYSRGWVYWRA